MPVRSGQNAKAGQLCSASEAMLVRCSNKCLQASARRGVGPALASAAAVLRASEASAQGVGGTLCRLAYRRGGGAAASGIVH